MKKHSRAYPASVAIPYLAVLAGLFVCCGLSAAQNNSANDAAGDNTAEAIFAGGCFWCMEPPFDKLDGVIATTSGYTGGSVPDPSYEEVSSGGTGHIEAVQVTYDPATVSYDELLDVYWRNIDPLDDGGQFCDRGNQYRSAIFAREGEQEQLARQSLQELQQTATLPGTIVTPVRNAGTFYPAEEYHQDYYMKNPLRYRFYRFTCGRDGRLEELWGD